MGNHIITIVSLHNYFGCIMNKSNLLIGFFLFFSIWNLFAEQVPEVWYRPDSLVSLSQEDSVSWTDEYTVFSVVRSLDDSTAQCLWSFAEDDTVSTAILTRGIYTSNIGTLHFRNPHDFSKWSVYAFHSGIYADSTKQCSLRLGEQMVYTDTATIDTLHSEIEMEEFAYFRGNVSKHASDAFQTYLALKYGVTLDYAPYISQSGDTLWHPTHDEEFYHRVVGLGNDTVCGWTGCMSQSKENPLWSIQTETLLPDEYIVMGDDNGSLDWHRWFDNEYLVPRIWRVRQKVVRLAPLTLVLRLSAMDEVAGSLQLTITDGNGTALQTILPDSIVRDSLCYFTLYRSDSLMNLQIKGTFPDKTDSDLDKSKQSKTGKENDTEIIFNTSSQTIIINGFPEGQVFILYLYDNVGKYLATVTSLNLIDVKTFPNIVSYIEIITDNQIVGAINIPISMF